MLLITFHGGHGGIKNIYAYSTSSGKLETKTALDTPHHVKLDELRGMAVYNGNLYVANGASSTSNVLCFQGPPAKGPSFQYLSTVIGEGQSISHPFDFAFDGAGHLYLSNQDTNVVAQVNLSANGQTGTLPAGCVSAYLNKLYPATPPTNAVFLDGTFVASQNGDLVNVAFIATNVSQANGGLAVSGTGTPLKPANSVRDVAIAGGILFVCDEVDSTINMYQLSDGSFIGSGALGTGVSPTHLAIANNGLWVSAGATLYWSSLPTSTGALTFQTVTLDPGVPSKNKIGGISFDASGNVYVVFQDGTHSTGQGSIERYVVNTGTPPTLTKGTQFAALTDDTPEFCLWVSDSHWPS